MTDRHALAVGFDGSIPQMTADIDDHDVEPALSPIYAGGVTAVQFEIPLDIVEILFTDADESASDGLAQDV